MRFVEIRDRIVNNPGINSLKEIKNAGYRVVKERDGGRYFLVRREELKPLSVRLGDIAEVRRGFTTGANEFFYLEPTGKPAPQGLMHVRNGAGWEGFLEEEFLKPVIKSPREVRTIVVRPEDLKYKVFMCHRSKKELKDTYALEYIKWGEKQGYHQRPTCGTRARWWGIPDEHGNTFWGKELLERIAVFASNKSMYADCRLYVATINKCLQGLLNSTVAILFFETMARQYGGGGGPRTFMVYEVKAQLLPKLSSFSSIQRHQVEELIQQLSEREIKSIFQELGLPKPNRDYSNIDPNDVSLDKVMPDRRELDRIIFEALGLTEEEQLEVYRAVVELVRTDWLR